LAIHDGDVALGNRVIARFQAVWWCFLDQIPIGCTERDLRAMGLLEVGRAAEVIPVA
jgi:hypothetical protein